VTPPPPYRDPSRADLVAIDVLGLVLDWTLASIMSAHSDLALECDAGRAGPELYLAESLTHQIAHLQQALTAYRGAIRDQTQPEDDLPF
jgi:hypothetical protein